MRHRQAEDGTIVVPVRIRPTLSRSAWALACLLMTPWALQPQEGGACLRPAPSPSVADQLDQASAVLSEELARCPDHPRTLEALAALRIQQGRPAEAEILADRLVRVLAASGGSSEYGWELLAVSRYLQDDTRGALRAWHQGRPRMVQSVEVLLFSPDRPPPDGRGTGMAAISGLGAGRPLTVEDLIQGERRLAAIPAAASARLGYRAISGGEVSVEGAVALQGMNPFGGGDRGGLVGLVGLTAHAARLLAGRVHLSSADPLGQLERWELSGSVEGTLRAAELSLAHPAPRGAGVWRWSLEHTAGSYAVHDPSGGGDRTTRQERTGFSWSHSDWVTAILRGSVEGRLDVQPGLGTFAGAGLTWNLVPIDARGRLELSGTGWTKVGGGPDESRLTEPGVRVTFGRAAVLATLASDVSSLAQAPSGFNLRMGMLATSRGAPLNLVPRMGSGGHVAVLMRGRSDLDARGVVRPSLQGTAWLHGGIEILRPLGTFGPIAFGIAAFADGARVISRSVGPRAREGPAGAVHLGLGLRARVPGMEGWLRTDWGVDPADGSSTVSAAWVRAGLP